MGPFSQHRLRFQNECWLWNKKFVYLPIGNAKTNKNILQDKFQNFSKYQISPDFAQKLPFSTPFSWFLSNNGLISLELTITNTTKHQYEVRRLYKLKWKHMMLCLKSEMFKHRLKMQIISEVTNSLKNCFPNSLWMASHSLNLTFAKTAKTIFSLWLICITWTLNNLTPLWAGRFSNSFCQRQHYATIQSVSRWNIWRLFRVLQPFRTAGSFSVRIILQQVFSRMPRYNISHLLMLTMSKFNGINAFQGTKLFRKPLDICVWKNC